MNQCPTIFLSFKDVDGLTFDSAYGMLEATIAELFRKYTDLLDSENVNDYDKEAFRRILKGEAGTTGIKKSLSLLMRMLSDHYGNKWCCCWMSMMFLWPRRAITIIIRKC